MKLRPEINTQAIEQLEAQIQTLERMIARRQEDIVRLTELLREASVALVNCQVILVADAPEIYVLAKTVAAKIRKELQ